MLKAGFYEAVYHSEESVRKAAEALGDHDFELIVANDIDTLPVVLTHRERAKILFDAHEYTPRQFEHWFLWRFFHTEVQGTPMPDSHPSGGRDDHGRPRRLPTSTRARSA